MQPIDDVQNSADNRNIAVNQAGIKGLRHPVQVADIAGSNGHASIATFDMFVNLPAHQKGTHMSRFVEILNEAPVVLSTEQMPALLDTLVTRLEAEHGFLKASFPFFIEKTAPVSKAKSLMDYEVILSAELIKKQLKQTLTVKVPITSLCPCSKKISAYGAHNQRSLVVAEIEYDQPISITDLIQKIEAEASCELYALLKRPDEKVVTERAYDNPKFVEDMVRDVARSLQSVPAIRCFTLTSENFESIHNHSAFAQIIWDRHAK